MTIRLITQDEKRSGGVHKWRIALLTIATPLFFLTFHEGIISRSFLEFLNVGHTVYFCLLTTFFLNNSLLKKIPFQVKVILCLILVFFIGCGIELLQRGAVERSSNWGDVGRNMLGAALAVLWSYKAQATTFVVKNILVTLMVGLLIVTITPLGIILLDEYVALKQFPLLAGFETKIEFSRWRGNAKLERRKEQSRPGNYSALMHPNYSGYSSIELYSFPEDWSRQKWLSFSVYSNLPSITLHYRIHDKLHEKGRNYTDRFNGTVQLNVGWNDVRVALDDVKNGPKTREMDLKNIKGLILFVKRPSDKLTLYFDDVCLLP